MTHDELAEQGGAWIRAVEAAVEALDDGPAKTRLRRHARLVHQQLELMRDIAAEGSLVQPFSGGDPKPPTP